VCGNSTDSNSRGGSNNSSGVVELFTEDAVEFLRLMTYNLTLDTCNKLVL